MASVTVQVSTPYDGIKPRQSYDLLITVIESVGMPKEIFMFQRNVKPVIVKDTNTATFICVADPADLEETPDVDDLVSPAFRALEVKLRFRDIITLEETKDLILSDIHGLTTAISESLVDNQIVEVIL